MVFAALQASLSITNSQSLLKLMSIGVNDAIQLSYLLFPPYLLSPPSVFPLIGSSHQVAKIFEVQLEHQSFQ